MKNMNKAELIDLMSKSCKGKCECSKKDVTCAVDMFIDGIKRGLAKADKVTLIGFGTFYKLKRKAGKGRNPRTGEEIKIPAAVLPKFKAGKALKEACN